MRFNTRDALTVARLARGAIFWTGIVAATLLARSPVSPTRVALLMPLAIVYGVALQVIWCRPVYRLASDDASNYG